MILLYLMVATCIIDRSVTCSYGEQMFRHYQWFSIQSIDEDVVSFEVYWDQSREPPGALVRLFGDGTTRDGGSRRWDPSALWRQLGFWLGQRPVARIQ